jgi:hypothetical protein
MKLNPYPQDILRETEIQSFFLREMTYSHTIYQYRISTGIQYKNSNIF